MGLQEVSETQDENTEQPTEVRLPVSYYTYVLMACITTVFAAQFLTSDDPEFFTVDRYSSFLAGFDKQAFLKGEYWRILTGATIHSGILHFAMNSYALYSLGLLIEIAFERRSSCHYFCLVRARRWCPEPDL